MKLTQREKDLIQTGLYMLESACIVDELDYESAEDLGGIPDSEEVRLLMEKIDKDED